MGHSDDMTMDMMNDTMGNMTMNATEMANDTITDAAEEMPASDDGRRKLLEGHEGHSDGDDHEGHSDDDTMDMMNDTMGNMTANATEMANDTITDAAEEMPASDDRRRKLLEGHEGHSDGDDHSHSDDDTMDMMNDAMGNMTMNGTDDMANDTIAEDPEEMPASDDGRRKLF